MVAEEVKTPVSGGGWYANYVLIVLVLVYILNFIDRQILAVLAESIKADLGISDADLGFLFGTAFSVFYAVIGMPLARLADTSNRKNLIACGLSVWSLMTALSGFARGFLPLSVCRFGVGIGEASASPAAYSLLYDYFSPKVRTTVLAFYSSGIFIGQGIGIVLGGAIATAWTAAYPDAATAPFELRGWQAAFLFVGTPGILLALWVFTLREPVRGRLDGANVQQPLRPLREALAVALSMIPPFSIMFLSRAGIGAIILNLSGGALISAGGYALTRATGDFEQWTALGIGLYAVLCWAQDLAHRDQLCFSYIFKNPALLLTVAAAATGSFMLSGFGFWTIPYYQRHFGLDAQETGLLIGAGTIVMGFVGVTLGGVFADRLIAKRADGKLIVVMASLIGSLFSAGLVLFSGNLWIAYVGSLGLIGFSSAGLGPAVSMFNDLVLPQMRATSSAFGFMATFLFAGALGPYFIGKLSDVFLQQLDAPGIALQHAMGLGLIVPLFGIVFTWLAMRATRLHARSPISK